MSRIGPPDRLTRLMNLIGAEKVGNRKNGRKEANTGSVRQSDSSFLTEVRSQLVSDLASIETDSEEGRRQARNVLVHRLVSSRLRHLELPSAQVSHIAQRVRELSRERPEIQQLLSDVVEELIATG
jgi:hypothetical protein